jgi:chemotaxis protein MotB
MFLLLVYVVSELYLREALSGRDEALERLSVQVNQLAEDLALEKRATADLETQLEQMSSALQATVTERDELVLGLGEMTSRAEAAEGELDEARLERERLLRDITALRTVRDELEEEVGHLAVTVRESEDKAADLARELTTARDRSSVLEARLTTEQERTHLAQRKIEETEARLKASDEAFTKERTFTAAQRAQIEILNQNIVALRTQLASIAEALEAAEAKDKAQQVQIADLGRRLNVALARKVQELARYRSEFFGRLREILGERKDIRVAGDRFIFQSEVLFNTGSANLEAPGREQLALLAESLKEISGKIPAEIDWVLRVDGHTDRRPINTPQFPSNWELSTARAISVVQFLVARGIPAQRLAATGFGEFQPLDESDDEIAFRRNRRIELKLTQR